MPKLRVKVTTFGLDQKKGRLSGFSKRQGQILKEELAVTKEQIRRFVDNPDTSATRIALRSGSIYDSIDYDVVVGRKIIYGTVGSIRGDLKTRQAAKTQERGRTISAVRAKFLAFPPSEGGRPARGLRGMQLLTARQAGDLYRLRYTRSSIYGEVELGQEQHLFIRKQKVTIPARPFVAPFREPLRKRLRDRIIFEALNANQR